MLYEPIFEIKTNFLRKIMKTDKIVELKNLKIGFEYHKCTKLDDTEIKKLYFCIYRIQLNERELEKIHDEIYGTLEDLVPIEDDGLMQVVEENDDELTQISEEERAKKGLEELFSTVL